MSRDLQKFIEHFEPAKFKTMPGGIEIRGARDIHGNMSRARALIEKLNLGLTVRHNAEMSGYGAFEVNCVSPGNEMHPL